MIKLKIGDNYLITTQQDLNSKDFIIYMMSCFKAHNKLVLGFDVIYHLQDDFSDYLKAVKEEQPRELFILMNPIFTVPIPFKKKQEQQIAKKLSIFITRIKNGNPDINIKVIRIGEKIHSREFKLASTVYESLRQDKKSILNHLESLDEYKGFANRFKAIPAELKVINENIKALSKEKKVCDRVITLESLNYLNLIDNVSLSGKDLIVTIKPIQINPSEPFGKCIYKDGFRNKYLAKTTEYLYKGYHFGMVGTKIAIRTDFRPEFIETLDHTWDDMFVRNNWSNIGYLHFGKGHLCGGEFNDVIAHTGEHGLEYYFVCLKSYISTANVRDYAGKKVWWYPIYDDNGKLVYCAALDILRDCLLGSGSITSQTKNEIKDMDWEQFLRWKKDHGIDYSIIPREKYSENVNFGYSGRDGDSFLEYCKENNPELYKELEEGARTNG